MSELNEGARLLQCVKGSLADIAKELAPVPSRQGVGAWRRGDALPSDDYRAELERVFGIPRASWSRRISAGDPSAPQAPAAAPAVDAPTTAIEDLRRTVARIDTQLVRLEASPETNPGHLAQLFNAKTNAVAKLARLTGEGAITMTMIVRSQAWADLLARLEPVFAEHKAAAAAIARVLEEAEAA